MSATISQIAEKVGVSTATVSMVLNMRPGISTETRERVFEAAALFNYEKHRGSFRNPKQRTVRFLMITKHGHILNPNHRAFIADYIEGIEKEAQSKGITIEISTFSSFNPSEILESIAVSNSEGTILLGTELSNADLELFRTVRKPLVFLDTYNSALDWDFVDMNNDSSVHELVEYLVSQGHERIGLVKGSIETRNFKLREKSFMEALEKKNLPFLPSDLFSIDSTYEQGCVDMKTALEKANSLPTALFCVNDIIAYSCMSALSGKGYKIPDDISIIGFDDLPSNKFADPPLTSISVSKTRIGQCAMQLMASRMEDPFRPSEKILIGGRLIHRSTVKKITNDDRGTDL